MSRHARQTVLPGVGAGGQARLAAARVLVVGAGGLGVPVLQYLAGAGVGRIVLVDGDTVEETNLHRQPLYRMEQIGQPKAEAAAAALRALDPGVTVVPLVGWLDPVNVLDLVAGADLALDCADTLAVSLTLSDTCRALGVPLVSASALGLLGYAGGFCGPAPSLRAVFPEPPDNAATCAEAGVLGPVVATLGAVQAQMALAVLLGLSPSPLGRVVSFDAGNWRFGGFRFDGAAEPGRVLPFLAPSQLAPGDLVIDLRTEAPAPVMPEALRLDTATAAGFAPPPGTARVVMACRTGLRAHRAGAALQARWPGRVALMAVPDG